MAEPIRKPDRSPGFCLTEFSVTALIIGALVVSALLWLAIWVVL